MECPHCHANNTGEARFCAECGKFLHRPCTVCGHVPEPNHKFCIACGADLLKVPAAAGPEAPTGQQGTWPETGQRRQATVFFSDLSGYTEMNERLDPEEVKSLVGRIKEEAVRIVEEHGGSVNQFVGDEVLALFGIPTTHHDDPARAVRAVLELHATVARIGQEVESRIGKPLRMHTGINTGLIVTDLRDTRDGRVGITGDAVNIGARLKAAAGNDEILVGEETHLHISQVFQTEKLDPLNMKGKSTPLSIYRVVGEKKKEQHRVSALIGREKEFRSLVEILEKSLASGSGQSLLLRGDPGIGKTRLTREFQRHAESLGVTCHGGLVFDFGPDTGRGAIREILNSMLGVSNGEGQAVRKAAAEGVMKSGILPPETAGFFHALLDLPVPAGHRPLYEAMENDIRIQRRRETLVAFLQAVSEKSPLLLTIEDIHWADEVMLGHLSFLTRAVAEMPVVFLMTTRVETDPLDAKWYEDTGGAPLFTLNLHPLGFDAAQAFAGTFPGVDVAYAATCVRRSEGNPLFLEQLLLNAGNEHDGEELPGSVQSIVQARMDTLPARESHALQAAAVLGQRFSLDSLRYLMEDNSYDEALLMARGLFRSMGTELIFSHALIREGAYQTLLRSRRRELHGRAAEWFTGKDVVMEARHLDLANDNEAPRAYLTAARSEAEQFRNDQALALAERGLDILADRPAAFSLNLFHAEILLQMGRTSDAEQAYRRALGVAKGDSEECSALLGLASAMRMSDQIHLALETLGQAESLAAKHNLIPELARIHHLRGNLKFPLGDLEGCQQEHQKALELSRQAGLREEEAGALGGLGDAFYLIGKMKSATEQFQLCLEICREQGYRRLEVENGYMAGYTRIFLNNLREGMAQFRDSFEMAVDTGHQRAEMLARNGLGHILCEFQRFGEARVEYQSGLEISRRLLAKRFEAEFLCSMGNIEAWQGDLPSAKTYMQEALALAEETGMGYFGTAILGNLAWVAEDAAEKKRLLAQGRNLLQKGSVSHNHFYFYRLAMDISLQSGEFSQAEGYAADLEAFTRDEPLPWSDFYMARTRALAALARVENGEGGPGDGDALAETLHGLHEEGQRVGLLNALPALEAALERLS